METWIVAVGWGARAVLVVLVGLSVWSFAVMIDRSRIFKNIAKSEDSEKAKNLIAELNWKALSEYVSGQSSMSSGMLHRATQLNSQDPDRIERLIKSYLNEKKAELERGLTVLATLGSNAPFIGLFGTVLGIIQAFGVLGQKQASAAGASVMTGISEALIATAIGLFVAIPAVVAYNVFSRRLKLVLMECESLRDLYLSHLGLSSTSNSSSKTSKQEA